MFNPIKIILSVLIAISPMEAIADTTQPAPAGPHCNHVFDANLLQKFTRFYNKAAEPSTFETLDQLMDFQMFDCDYMYIIEARPKSGVFGVSEAYIFRKRPFEFLGTLMIK